MIFFDSALYHPGHSKCCQHKIEILSIFYKSISLLECCDNGKTDLYIYVYLTIFTSISEI